MEASIIVSGNGLDGSPPSDAEWIAYREKMNRAIEKIDTMHTSISVMVGDTKQLPDIKTEVLKLNNSFDIFIQWFMTSFGRLLAIICALALGRGVLDIVLAFFKQ